MAKEATPTYTHVHPEALKQATAEALARLELEKHQIELVKAIKDEGDETLISENETAGQAIARLNEAIARIEKQFPQDVKDQ